MEWWERGEGEGIRRTARHTEPEGRGQLDRGTGNPDLLQQAELGQLGQAL